MSEKKPTIRKPPHDPNWLKNRIPSREEFNTLRNIHHTNRVLADNVKAQLTIAKENHERIQMRYDAVHRELECLQSELNASYRLISMLEKQEKAFEVEDDRLKGLIHPIRRCPEDILKLVFEAAVVLGTNWFKTATMISHVCRAWRSIALSTGLLWSHIKFSMNDDPDSVVEFLQCMNSRLRSTPAEITLEDIGSPDYDSSDGVTPRKFMELVELSRFKSIKSLELHLLGGPETLALLQSAFYYSGQNMGRLVLTIESEDTNQSNWDYQFVLHQFPYLQELEISSTEVSLHIRQRGTRAFPLKKLRFELVKVLDFEHQMSRHASLEKLELEGVTFSDTAPWPAEIKMPHLHSLRITCCPTFPWNQFIAPQLQSLIIHDEDEERTDFICRHTTITHLDASMSKENFHKTATSLPHVVCLDVAGTFADCFFSGEDSISARAFPKLTQLTVELEDMNLTLEAFESFVNQRFICQPSSESTGEELRPLEVLEIVIYRRTVAEVLREVPGLSSQYMERFEQTLIEPEDAWSRKLHLRWLG